jgi:MFS family permease
MVSEIDEIGSAAHRPKKEKSLGVPEQPTRMTWLVIGILVLLEASYILNSMDRSLFPILVPEIREEYGFQLTEVGFLASIFTLGVGLGGIPAGYIIDRYSTKAIVLMSIFIFSATTALQTVAVGFADMAVYRILSGLGEGVQVAVLFAALGVLFKKRRTLALGTLNFCFGVGGFLGPLLGAHLLGATDSWRMPMWVFAAAGLFFIVALYFVMPSTFGQTSAKTETQAKVKERYMNLNVAILLGIAAISGFYLFSFVSLYPTYLREVFRFSPAEAGLTTGAFGLGALMGIPAGWLGDRFNQKTVTMAALIGASGVGAIAFTSNAGLGGQMVIAFLAGTFISGFMFTNTQALLQRSMPLSRTGMASGLFVTFWFMPATLSGLVFGALKQSLGWATAGGFLLGGLPLVALVGLLFFNYGHVRSERAAQLVH